MMHGQKNIKKVQVAVSFVLLCSAVGLCPCASDRPTGDSRINGLHWWGEGRVTWWWNYRTDTSSTTKPTENIFERNLRLRDEKPVSERQFRGFTETCI